MDNLIKYRNDRKSEGATIDELKPVDAQITTLLKRSQMVWAVEVVPKAVRGEMSVKILDGTDSMLRSGVPYTVVANLDTETVGDLAARACKVIGVGFMGVKLVNGDTHLDLTTPLRSTLIRDGSLVAICNRLNCNGTCPAAGLCQPSRAEALARAMDKSEVMLALMRAAKVDPLEKACAVACEAVPGGAVPGGRSAPIWAALKAHRDNVATWHEAPAEQSAPAAANTFEDIPEEELYA